MQRNSVWAHCGARGGVKDAISGHGGEIQAWMSLLKQISCDKRITNVFTWECLLVRKLDELPFQRYVPDKPLFALTPRIHAKRCTTSGVRIYRIFHPPGHRMTAMKDSDANNGESKDSGATNGESTQESYSAFNAQFSCCHRAVHIFDSLE